MSAILFANAGWMLFVGAALLLAAAVVGWSAALVTASAVRLVRGALRTPPPPAAAADEPDNTAVLAPVEDLSTRLRKVVDPDAPTEVIPSLVLPGRWEPCTPHAARRARRRMRGHRQGVAR